MPSISYHHLPFLICFVTSPVSSWTSPKPPLSRLSFSPSCNCCESSSLTKRTRYIRTQLIQCNTIVTTHAHRAATTTFQSHFATIGTNANHPSSEHSPPATATASKETPTALPRHIAFICDGNSRWAERKSLPKSMGHAAGADRVMSIITSLQRWQVHRCHR